jgi:5-methylthioribose kinase
MGFDVGAVIGNLLMSYFSQDGHATAADPREAYREWILTTVEEVWEGFAARFLAHWRANVSGDAWPADLFAGPEGGQALEDERRRFMRALFVDTLGFAAAKTIRRILGLAHNIDFEHIADKDQRALCEGRALALARTLMLEAGAFSGIAEVTALAREVRARPSPWPGSD